MRCQLIIICCCFVLCAQSQTDTVMQETQGIMVLSSGNRYSGKVSHFTADNLGNVYVFTTEGLLKKFNSRGDSLCVFNDVRRYGTVYALDVTNPLKVLLYYKDFSTILMLDRFLNRINMIDLRKSGIFQAKAVGLSYDNNVWVFDEQAAKLKKIGEDGRLISETVDLRQVLNVLPSPEKIIDRDGFVYLYDSTKGLYIFDYYGVLKNELPLAGIRDIQVFNKSVVGRRQNNFIRYTLGSLELQELTLPPFIQQEKKICITQQGVYVLDKSGIKIYPYQ